ncbi:sarcosine dehydrogenase, mitochondrial-like isoform X2 [Styela clava]
MSHKLMYSYLSCRLTRNNAFVTSAFSQQRHLSKQTHNAPPLHKDKSGVLDNVNKSLPDSADVVVIGGGSVGCSTAYHLAKLKAGKVVLIEKDRLTSGTTWHTGGIVWNLRDGRPLTQMQVQTIDLASRILPEETGFDAGWIKTGAIFLTRSKNALDALERKALIGSEFGIEASLVDADQISKLHPFIETKNLLGGVYSPNDGSVDPATLCTSYIKAATKYGAEVFEKCEVKDIKTTDLLGLKQVNAIETNLGTIKTNNVVNCTGAWGPYIAKMVGVKLPQVIYKLTYVVTQGIQGMEKTPHIRDSETGMYYKRQGDALLFGGYEKNPVFVDKVPNDFAFSLYDMDWEQFEVHMKSATDLMPCIEKSGIRSTLCGPETFTPDGNPLMGEFFDVKGFFNGTAFNGGGMMLGGGAGRQLAHWIVQGSPEYDLSTCHVNRFTRKINDLWLVESCHDHFTTKFEVRHPDKQKLGGRNLRTTPLTKTHQGNGAYLVSIHGWEVPAYFMPGQHLPLLEYDYYGEYGNSKHATYKYREQTTKDTSLCTGIDQEIHEQIMKETLACFKSSAIIDLSHCCKFRLDGPGSDEVVNSLFHNNVKSFNINTETKNFMLNKDGNIISSCIVTRFNNGVYQVTAPSEMQESIKQHINHFLHDSNITNCGLHDITDEYAVLHVVGPKSEKLLENVLLDSFELNPGNIMDSRINNLNVVVSRIAENNFDWYVIRCPMKDVHSVYTALITSEIKPTMAGLRALNSVCLESGIHNPLSTCLNGSNLREVLQTSQLELNDTRQYIGKDALIKAADQPLTSRFIQLKAESELPILDGDVIWYNDSYVGIIGDAAYGYKTGRYFVNGFVKLPLKEGGKFTIGRRSHKVQAEVTNGSQLPI